MIPEPTEHDYELADAIKQRREANPNAQPTLEELAAIDRILIQQARDRELCSHSQPS